MPNVLQFPAKALAPPTIADAPARAAALDTRASAIVEAPAGSGKTGLLTQRFLKLLADPETAQPEEVLAMTFTRKATAEMKERVFDQLQSAALDTPLKDPTSAFEQETRAFAQAALARSRQRGWDLLAQPQRLNIRSILSVCMDLANALPLLSGTGGRQEPIEDARALYAQAARRTLMQLGNQTPENLKETAFTPSIPSIPNRGASAPEGSPLHHALRTVLLHRDASLRDTERLLADMLAAREQWAELVPLTPGQLDDDALDAEVRPRLERALEVAVCAGLTRAIHALPANVLHDLTAFARRLAHEPGYKDAPSPISICADKHLPPEAVAEHLDHWTTLIDLLLTKSGEWRRGFNINQIGFALPKADKALLQQLIAEIQTDPLQQALCAVRDLPPARYPDEQWRVARALFHVLRHALAELKLLFTERNECDFNELALGAREALAGENEALAGDTQTTAGDPQDDPATGLALAAGGHLRHLLVDEMQDTSSSQYELIRALTQSWDGHSQTLFLVGDPKQSIYLFRQARVERFLRTLHHARLGDIPLQPLRLTANFRSQATLVHDFNTTFGGSETTPGIFPCAENSTPNRPQNGLSHIDRPQNAVSHMDGPLNAVSHIDGPQNGVSHMDGPQNAVPHTDGPQNGVSYMDGPQNGVSHIDGPQNGVSHMDGPQNGVSHMDGPQNGVFHVDGPQNGVPHISPLRCGPAQPPASPQPASPHPPDPTTLDVPFVEAVPIRQSTGDTGIAWHTSLYSDAPDATPFDPRAHEALTIRQLIEERLATELPQGRTKPWSIAVLGRTRDHLATIVQEFKPHNNEPAIPFRAVDLDPLGELPEVLDALALTRALLHPADRVAWLAVLRTPWCGLALSDLLTLTSDGATKTPTVDPNSTIAELIRTRGNLLSEEAQQLLARAWPVLEAAVATLGRTPLATHVDRTWRSLGGDAALTSGQRTNVRRFLAILGELEADTGRVDLDTLSRRLKGLYAEPLAGDAQVELMTIHKAKGLEWDVVFIPGLERKPRASTPVLLNWLELDGEGAGAEASIILAPIYGKGAESDKLNRWLSSVRSRRERAEEKRLFYVAATRAREELHLFAALPERSGVLAQPAAGSLLKAAWPAAQPHFIAAQAAAAQPASSSLIDDLLQSLREPAWDEAYGLALAASADADATQPARYPTLQRLPLGFDPEARFAAVQHPTTTPHTAAFDRPDGSFAVRAFGNVVHRYLQLLATRLLTLEPDDLLTNLTTWQPRLEASLRGEGVAPSTAVREAARALLALQNTLTDPIGRWLLSPHPQAASESSLNLPQAGSLRVDRTFLAGPAPLSTGDTHIWIVDFKTTALNDRPDAAFAAAERDKYTAQLEAYAALRRTLPGTTQPICLGLYYPLIPRLLDWPSLSTPQNL